MIVKTAKGKEYESGYFVEDKERNTLCFDISGADRNEVNDTFCDPEETCLITYGGKEYENYTRFRNIEVFADSIRVRLGKNG